MTQAIDQDLAPIVTTSYGECEAGWGSTELNIMNQLFKRGNAQGQTILAAAGDEGATDCDAGPLAIEGLTVDFPGSSPYVTSMGGTSFNEGNANGTTQYWSGNSSSSMDNAGSAISYIPETIWNDNSIDSFAGGGGGASAFFIKPAWQTGTGVPADGSRDVPDLSLSASNSHDTFLYCINVALNDSCTSGFRIASGVDINDLTTAGGTSFDSQIFGGMLALVEQKIGPPYGVGNANQIIYALANNTAYYTPGTTCVGNLSCTVVFNDVTTGNNDMPCQADTPSCPNAVPLVTGFSTGLGYDLASGWGSVNVNNLASAWNVVTPLVLAPNLSATTLTASASSVIATTAVTLTATVTGMTVTSTGTQQLTTVPGPTPAGSVQFFDNGVAVGSQVALNASGVATYQLATGCSALGQQLLTAAYLGSSTYQGSKGPALAPDGAAQTSNGSTEVNPLIVSVTAGTCPTFTITPLSQTVTTPSAGTPVASLTLASVNSFAGAVTLTASATETTSYAPGFSFNINPVNLTASGATSSATFTLTLTGIVANLHMPSAPGNTDSGTVLARNTSPPKPPAKGTWYAAGSGATIASILLLALPRKRRLGGLLLVAFAIALISGVTGCGASSQAGPPAASTNPYAGTYYVTVVGTSGSLSTSATVTFDVQ
jgi:subtilase family serine protease